MIEWFGAFRFFYNETIRYCEKNKKYNFRIVRNNLRNEETRKFNLPHWVDFKLPSRLISGAISDCCKAYKTCFTLLKNKIIEKFDMKFKTKKDPMQTLYLEKDCFAKDKSLFKTTIKNFGKLRSFKRKAFDVSLEELNINHDCRISYDAKRKQWYLILPEKTNLTFENQELNEISLDPGTRTFLTSYSPEGICFDIGKGAYKRIYYFLKVKDKLRSLLDLSTNRRKRKSFARASRKHQKRIEFSVDELHWKTINFLNKNFKKILIGDIEVSSICKNKSTSKITKRLLLSFRFFEFKQRLEYKCGKRVQKINEAWTSKTCGSCGNIKFDLGSSKVYSCSKCNYETDRDVNGARNIYLKSK